VAKEDAASGVGPARLSALSVLVFRGPLTLGELAEAEGVKPPTMTKIVNGLERARLVRKEAVAGDRRSVRIIATAEGRRLLQAARRRRLRVLAKRLGHLSERDLATLARAAELMEEAAR
jgi:DNA-binding MarR family transcriptional regulator